jgi:hypothetical protein
LTETNTGLEWKDGRRYTKPWKQAEVAILIL